MTVMLAAERTAAPAVYAQPRRADALSLTEMTPADVWRFCEKLADTPLLPDAYRRNPSSVLWAMEYGRALGLDVVTTISTIHVIKGKPSQSADLMLSRTRAAGHRVRVQPGDGECTVSIFRADDPEFENRITWTYDDAVRAGLCTMRDTGPYSRSSKGEPQSWEKYPRAMLRARAISECVRMACPEVLHGAIYTPEELGAVIDQDGNPLPDAAPSFARQAPAQDQWEQATPAPVQQTPPDVVAAGVADVPAESLTPAGRDYLHEAMAAPDAATVRQIWQDARTEGAVPECLAQIAEVGKGKAAAEQQAAEDDAEEPPLTRDGYPVLTGPLPAPEPETLPGSPDDPKARGLAVVELYAAGREGHSLTPGEVQQAFTDRYKHAVDAATLAEIAEFTADLTAAAGTR
jgi:hypothetical protein